MIPLHRISIKYAIVQKDCVTSYYLKRLDKKEKVLLARPRVSLKQSGTLPVKRFILFRNETFYLVGVMSLIS